MSQPQVIYTFSGADNQDASYPLAILIDANGVQWKIRIGTDGILTTVNP